MNDGIGMTTLSRILALDEPERVDRVFFIEDVGELYKARAKRTPVSKHSWDKILVGKKRTRKKAR